MNSSSGKGLENSHSQRAPSEVDADADADAAGAGTTHGVELFPNIHPNTLQSRLRRGETENKEQPGNSICHSFIHLTNVYIGTIYASCHCKYG